jgi:hypothetical protein
MLVMPCRKRPGRSSNSAVVESLSGRGVSSAGKSLGKACCTKLIAPASARSSRREPATPPLERISALFCMART